MQDVQEFPRLPGSVVLAIVFLTLLGSTALSRWLWPQWAADPGADRLHEALSQLLWYGMLACVLYAAARLAGVDHVRVRGKSIAPRQVLRFATWALPAVALSLATAYMLFIPLSFVDPQTIEELLDDNVMGRHLSTGITFDAANLLLYGSIGIAAPLVEEYAFRGLLLSRWAGQWGTSRAVVASSLAFAVWHIDPLGGFVFGYAAAVAYVVSGSLWAPIVLHIANNSIAFGMAAVGSGYAEQDVARSITQFQDQWPIGLLAAAIGLPWGIMVFRRYRFLEGRAVPYQTEA